MMLAEPRWARRKSAFAHATFLREDARYARVAPRSSLVGNDIGVVFRLHHSNSLPRSSPGLTGRSSTPETVALIDRPLEYWMPGLKRGMTAEGHESTLPAARSRPSCLRHFTL